MELAKQTWHGRLAVLGALTLAGQLFASSVMADVVEVYGGARLTGVTPEQQARKTISIELEGGGRLTIDRDHVKRVASESEALIEYRKRAPTAPDTIESQWALAQWCKQRRLGDEYRRHLERVIQLDPEHQQARALLGYQRHAGRWLTREQMMVARGMVRYRGNYRTRQEVALLERSERSKQRNSEWKSTFERWRKNLSSRDPKRVSEAMQEFRSLRDPSSGYELASLLLEESAPNVKMLLIETAARIRTGPTVTALTKLALEDEDEETRLVCLEHLMRNPPSGLAEPFVRTLEHRNNGMVNRAAAALQQIGGKEVVVPLIKALITTHRFQVGESSGGGQRFDIRGGTGAFSFGGGGAKVVSQDVRNPEVLSALVQITGENFGYDQEQWREWLLAEASAGAIDIRRDP